MPRPATTLRRVLSAQSDANIRFADLVALLLYVGFDRRIQGDHHIFSRQGVVEIVNLQPIGALAKTYQVRQVRQIIIRYRLGGVADV